MFGNKILEIRKSKYNGEIKVKRTFGMGTYIQAGGITQSGGIVKKIWGFALKNLKTKKRITRSARVTHFVGKNCLILGLGGGTVAGLIRKKFPNAKITGVEIDPVMVEMGKKYLNLDKIDVDIKIADARKFYIGNYDLVIVDTYLGDKYVDMLNSDLSGSGIVVFNRLYLKNDRENVNKFEKKLKKVFSSVLVVKPLVNRIFICRK